MNTAQNTTPIPLPDNAIEITNLVKVYAKSPKSPPKHALKGVSLNIKRGSIFGLLGPNGAGKSTLINIMAGLVRKTSGSVKIWDYDIDTDARQSRAAIGIVPQELNLDAFFTPKELLEVQAGMYGVPKSERRTMELLETVGLSDKANAYARTLSGGMRRRLMVAKAMVHAPPILVLDEPTAGVDIALRKSLWENVLELNKRGVTIVLTTHYLEEAQELCDTIAIINHGEVVACEPKTQLLQRVDSKVLSIRLNKPLAMIPPALQDLELEQPEDTVLQLNYHTRSTLVGEVLSRVTDAGLGIVDVTTSQADLEDIFLQLTGG